MREIEFPEAPNPEEYKVIARDSADSGILLKYFRHLWLSKFTEFAKRMAIRKPKSLGGQ